MSNLADLFEKHDDEFLKFGRITSPKHPAPDLCAFLMLHEIAPTLNAGNGKVADMVAYAGHDEITLCTNPATVAEKATEQQLIDLIRCGLRYSEDIDCFQMFV